MEIKNYFAQDAQGNIMPSANCYLYLPGTTTLATGLVDGSGTPISNPFLASSVGQVEFGAPNGVYDLRIAQGARDFTIEIQCADLLQALNETASFLGAKSSAPTTRNDGYALQIADRYFNTVDQLEYLYKSTGWVANNLDGQLLATIQGASLLGAVMQDGSAGTVQQAIDIGDKILRQDLGSPIGASMVFNKSDLAEAVGSAIVRSVKGRLADEVSAKDFVIGDGVSDESVAFQALVDRISSTGGGCILMPAGIYQASFIAKPGVTFVGASYGASRGNIGFSAVITRHTTVFKAAPGKTWIIDTPTGGANNFGVLGIDFQGGGLTIPGGGIYMRAGTNNSIVRACSFNNFSEQALVTDGLIGYFESLSGTNCLLSRARTQRSGVFEFGGADNFIVSIQGNTGITTLYSEDLFLCGILVKGANNYGLHLEGELSEVGVYVTSTGAPHKITSSRADLNFGPGLVATAGMFVNCHSLNNSQAEDGKYDAFVFGADVQATGCKAETRGRPNRHGYGVGWLPGADVSSFASQPLLDCFTSAGHSKGAISDTLFNGFKFVFPNGWCRGTGATPSVESVSTYIPVDTAPVTLTGFNSMVKGQELTVLGNANVTLQRSATFIVNGVNGNGVKKLSTGKVYRFLRGNGITYEIGGDTPAVGTTSERPNTFAQPGLMYLDTTLAANGKPIFRNALNTGWVDSSGASV